MANIYSDIADTDHTFTTKFEKKRFSPEQRDFSPEQRELLASMYVSYMTARINDIKKSNPGNTKEDAERILNQIRDSSEYFHQIMATFGC
jgi:uncharacterized protein (UPF0305 family)